MFDFFLICSRHVPFHLAATEWHFQERGCLNFALPSLIQFRSLTISTAVTLIDFEPLISSRFQISIPRCWTHLPIFITQVHFKVVGSFADLSPEPTRVTEYCCSINKQRELIGNKDIRSPWWMLKLPRLIITPSRKSNCQVNVNSRWRG